MGRGRGGRGGAKKAKAKPRHSKAETAKTHSNYYDDGGAAGARLEREAEVKDTLSRIKRKGRQFQSIEPEFKRRAKEAVEEESEEEEGGYSRMLKVFGVEKEDESEDEDEDEDEEDQEDQEDQELEVDDDDASSAASLESLSSARSASPSSSSSSSSSTSFHGSDAGSDSEEGNAQGALSHLSREVTAAEVAAEAARRKGLLVPVRGSPHIRTDGSPAPFAAPIKGKVARFACLNLAGLEVPVGEDAHARLLATFSPEERELYELMGGYRDVWYASTLATRAVLDPIKLYTIHAVDHIIKQREREVRGYKTLSANPDADVRDKGFTRCSVLIMAATRERAVRIVEMLQSVVPDLEEPKDAPGCKGFLLLDRFIEEFTDDSPPPRRWDSLPEDYKDTFAGNKDDCFHIGISFRRRQTVKMYSGPLGCDLLVASPLGLELLVKVESDFMSSVELLVIDQGEALLMQNYEHVKGALELINRIPKENRGTDFSRVRPWYLDGLARHYRQTVIFSQYFDPVLNATFRGQCFNTLGRVLVDRTPPHGCLGLVVRDARQIFQRVACGSVTSSADDRFRYFEKNVFPRLKSSVSDTGTVIFVASYFDFLRLRRLLKDEDANYAPLSEYTSGPDATSYRAFFAKGKIDILLYTERYHYFFRPALSGVKNLIFYSLPASAHFFPEMVNKLPADEPCTCLALFTKYDRPQLERIVGVDRAERLITAERPTHLFLGGEGK